MHLSLRGVVDFIHSSRNPSWSQKEELEESRQPGELKPLHLGQVSTFKNVEVAVQIVAGLNVKEGPKHPDLEEEYTFYSKLYIFLITLHYWHMLSIT